MLINIGKMILFIIQIIWFVSLAYMVITRSKENVPFKRGTRIKFTMRMIFGITTVIVFISSFLLYVKEVFT